MYADICRSKTPTRDEQQQRLRADLLFTAVCDCRLYGKMCLLRHALWINGVIRHYESVGLCLKFIRSEREMKQEWAQRPCRPDCPQCSEPRDFCFLGG